MTDSVTIGLASAGTTAAAGTRIPRTSKFTQFSTVAIATPAATLPQVPILNAEYCVRNDGVGPLQIFPSAGTTDSSTATINGAAAGAAYFLAQGSSVKFMAVANVIATGATWLSHGLDSKNKVVRTIANATVDKTLTRFHSGHLIAVTQDAAYTITMPSPLTAAKGEGLRFDFTVGTAGANIVTIDCGAGLLEGGVIRTLAGAGNTTGDPAAGLQNIVLSANTPVGATVRLYSDGLNWKVSAMSSTATISFS